MSESAVQIIARGPRAIAEAAAMSLDSDPLLEGATYSILEEDEDRGIWRIDAFPNDEDDARGIEARLRAHDGLTVIVEKLADADWLAMSLSGLPPVRAGRFFIYGAHDQGLVPRNTVNLKIDAGAAFGAALAAGFEAAGFAAAGFGAAVFAAAGFAALDFAAGFGLEAAAAAFGLAVLDLDGALAMDSPTPRFSWLMLASTPARASIRHDSGV